MIYTIGHSTRSLDEFRDLLRTHGITQLADVRTVPKSRRHPHFAKEALCESLAQTAIAYRHMPALGGLRKPRPDSGNAAWHHEGFRGYADYVETPAFDHALDELISWAAADPRAPGQEATAVMCAEAVWWRCHRRLIADALVARAIEVRHIIGSGPAQSHELTP